MDKTELRCPLCGADTTFKFSSHEDLVECDECNEEFSLEEQVESLELSLTKWKKCLLNHRNIIKICNGDSESPDSHWKTHANFMPKGEK